MKADEVMEFGEQLEGNLAKSFLDFAEISLRGFSFCTYKKVPAK